MQLVTATNRHTAPIAVPMMAYRLNDSALLFAAVCCAHLPAAVSQNMPVGHRGAAWFTVPPPVFGRPPFVAWFVCARVGLLATAEVVDADVAMAGRCMGSVVLTITDDVVAVEDTVTVVAEEVVDAVEVDAELAVFVEIVLAVAVVVVFVTDVVVVVMMMVVVV